VTRNERLAALLAAHAADPAGAGAAARRAEVLALHAAGALAAPLDRLAAARLLLGGERRDELEAAQALALAAMAVVPEARPVAATAYDALRVLDGRPQKFGTRFTRRGGALARWPVDPTTTDSERAKWGLPPLDRIVPEAPASGGAGKL
jgi:hypothetical protein